VSRSSITHGAQFELPPPPPAGSFDARFIDGLLAEALSGNANALISVVNAVYPISVSWKSAAPERQLQMIVDGKATTIEPGSSAKINRSFKQLSIQFGGASAIPTAFRLEQNYPNPFNPTTRIQYDLPVESFVHLAIYNVLGQEVRTLVNETEQAGYRSVSVDGSNLPSGMYFYRIQAGGYTDVKKMLLLK
jgi:hypothetical protein